jgi:hypothetical protein
MGKKMKSQLKVVSGALMLALAGHAMAATDWLTLLLLKKRTLGLLLWERQLPHQLLGLVEMAKRWCSSWVLQARLPLISPITRAVAWN